MTATENLNEGIIDGSLYAVALCAKGEDAFVFGRSIFYLYALELLVYHLSLSELRPL